MYLVERHLHAKNVKYLRLEIHFRKLVVYTNPWQQLRSSVGQRFN